MSIVNVFVLDPYHEDAIALLQRTPDINVLRGSLDRPLQS